MKRILFWLIITLALVIGFLLYRSSQRDHLNVTPDAEREIRKAQQR